MARATQIGTPSVAKLILLTVALHGCAKQPEVESNDAPETNAAKADLSRKRYPHDYTEYEYAEILDGSSGRFLLTQGTVLDPDGDASPFAVVTLAQTFVPKRNCYLVTRADAHGDYVIRGDRYSEGASMVWAATSDGRLGASWAHSTKGESKTVRIKLHAGTSVLYVRDEKCKPIVGTSVTVFLSGIDDISGIVPPNIRDLLSRETDEYGMVRFPSYLTDGALGFDVIAEGHRPLARDFFDQPGVKLFVMSIDEDVVSRCAEEFLNELFPKAGNRPRVCTGEPD